MLTRLLNEKKPQLYEYLEQLGISSALVKDDDLLLTAFLHKSYSYDQKDVVPSNERLEFLGDAILGAVVAKLLFQNYKDEEESGLSLFKVALVREENLALVAREIGLDKYIMLSAGEEKNGGRDKDVILADCLEALLGYMFLDLGLQEVEKFIQNTLYSKLENIKKGQIKSYKTLLQELTQSMFKITPTYREDNHQIDSKGNVLVYKSEVYLNDEKKSEGLGSNKKKAQEVAAEKYYNELINK